jgi:hypothetical protein
MTARRVVGDVPSLVSLWSARVEAIIHACSHQVDVTAGACVSKVDGTADQNRPGIEENMIVLNPCGPAGCKGPFGTDSNNPASSIAAKGGGLMTHSG